MAKSLFTIYVPAMRKRGNRSYHTRRHCRLHGTCKTEIVH